MKKGLGDTRPRRGFGALRQLPSKRWQASYIGLDDVRHTAPTTFRAKIDAEAWLAAESKMVESPTWAPPPHRGKPADSDVTPVALTLADYAAQWLDGQSIRPLTRRDYNSLLKNHVLPSLGAYPISDLSRTVVRTWYATLPRDRPRARSKAQQLLHAILSTAVDDELVEINAAALGRRIAARPDRAKKVLPLSVTEVNAIAAGMPQPLQMSVLLGCWCALRYGELSELRRRDVRLPEGVLRVERAVIRVKGAYLVTRPKTDAGVRDIHIPPFLIKDLRSHLTTHVKGGQDALLFPASSGTHLHSSTFARLFATAAAVAGRPEATPHYLRHTGASLATSAGATTADVMARLGHTTPSMAMVYQHSLSGADARVAKAMSDLGTTTKRRRPRAAR